MKYRKNVCAVIADGEGRRVLVFRRVHLASGPQGWQFPQGGIHKGESPREAVLRELEEEIGTRRVEIVAKSAEPVHYAYPPEVRNLLADSNPEKGQYDGQEQTWFRVRLLDGESAIHFRHEPREFDAYRWVAPAHAVDLAVPFKAGAYREGLGALGLLSDRGG